MLNKTYSILGMKVNATSFKEVVNKVIEWSKNAQSKYICVATVHMIMESYDSKEFQKIVNSADFVTPDGMPLVWVLRILGSKNQERVYGPKLTPLLCEEAAKAGIPVGFYGSSPECLKDLTINLQKRFPDLKINYSFPPPFRSLTNEENEKIIKDINNSGVKILFIGLGCPKQEKWMAEHKGKINAVMVGVGAAFDFISGNKKQAPEWMQNIGMEWFFRLITEPKRLFWRYFYNNPRFIFLTILQLLGIVRFNSNKE